MKKIVALIIIVFLCFSMFPMFSAEVKASLGSAPEVVCVPFHGEKLAVPHDAWIGGEIILKGTAHDKDGDATMVAYKWDFGDGYTTDWISGVNPYIIEAKHTYTGTMADGTPYGPGKYFTAWLYVKDNENLVGKDSYFIAIRDKTLDVEVNVGLDNGLWWLHKQQIRATYGDGTEYGYWHSSYGYHVAFTATSTEAFELQGHLPSGNRGEDPYVETVQRGLNYLFNQFHTYSISQHTTYCPLGNPDVNSNGIGLACFTSDLSRQIYESGMALMTISSSGAPNRIATTGTADVVGRAYKDIVQDMVDFMAWAQSDPYTGVYEGGWRYYANYGASDNSVSQWPVIGMEAAERNFGTSGVTVPSFVRPELLKWLTYSQGGDGGFGYQAPGSWENTAKTGAGCAMLYWAGVPTSDTKFQKALSFLNAHWYDTASSYTNFGDYYTMYAIMKGMRIPHPNIELVGTHDWYAEYARYIIDEQNAYGGEYLVDHSWLSSYTERILATAWAVAILTPTLVMPGPVADAGPDVDNFPPTIPVKFDASGSYHRDPTKSIVLYEWDFESDGIWDYSGLEIKVEHAYPAYYKPDGSIDWDLTAKDYTATLRVTDNSDPPLQDIDTCVIHITAPPWKPVADPDGPYEGSVGVPIQLDGSKSYDPESKMYSSDHPWYETIAKYEWDLDNDGQFDDSTEIKPSWTWETPGAYSVGLKVTDSQPSGPGGTIGPLDVDIKYTTVVIKKAEEWSFSIITDLHIGRGYPDYGGGGWNDAGTSGQNYYLTERLNNTVKWIKDNRVRYNIKFVVVLGDIADSGEYSELEKAKSILDDLDKSGVPYVPVIGNHDVWPYTEDKEDSGPSGDSYFRKVFIEERRSLLQGYFEGWDSPLITEKVQWTKFVDGWPINIEWTAYLQNYAFSYKGIKFIALDFVAREPVPGGKGVGFDAVLWEGTLNWLAQNLKKNQPTIMLSHHPLVCPYGGFSLEEIETIEESVKISGAKVLANFAGHRHGYDPSTFMDANKIYDLGTPEGVQVITTEALMVASNEDEPKGIIRLIKVKDEEIIIPSKVEGEFRALNPILKMVYEGKPSHGKIEVRFRVNAFTKRFTTTNPGRYAINFGDSPNIEWSRPVTSGDEYVYFYHAYECGKEYTVKLYACGFTPEGEPIIETINQKIVLPPSSALYIYGYSPIDIIVVDPDGLKVSKQINEIPGAAYTEGIDFNGDGAPDDRIIIPYPKEGNYNVTLMPEPWALPTDTYSLEVVGSDATVVLAENTPINNIPAEPYVFDLSVLNLPPITELDFGEPKLEYEGIFFLTSVTSIALVAEDNPGGSGVASTAYRIYNASYDSGWITYTELFYLTGLSDGAYQIDYNSTDYAGNVESTNTVTVFLDNTPPTTGLTIGEPKYLSNTTYVTPDTPFILEADDAEGSGVYSIVYRIYNGTYDSGWLPHTEPFYLTSLADGVYTIEFNSTDNLGNAEATKSIQVTLFSWNYIFEDTYGRGTTLKINLAHKFFQFITPDKDYGIRNATYMRQCGRAIIIQHCDGELRLITISVDTKLDFCLATAWDQKTRKQYFLIDKAGNE